MRMLHHFLWASLLLALPQIADASDWYVMNASKTRCVDITTSTIGSGTPDLATPAGTQALYESLGEHVATKQLQDSAGAAIIMMHITDSSGDPFLDMTFYPSLTDCQFVLGYAENH